MAQDEERLKNPSDPASGRPSGSRPGNTGALPAGKVLATGKQQFLISPRRLGAIGTMAVQPLAFSFVEQTLRGNPDIEVLDTIAPRGLVGTLGDGLPGSPTVIVARMTPQNAENLNQHGRGELIVELDHALTLSAAIAQQPSLVLGASPVNSQASITIAVVGQDSVPVEGAEVYVFGALLPRIGVTDQRGQVSIPLVGDTPRSIQGVYVKPRADYWSFYQAQPTIDPDKPNICVLKPLSSTLPNFPRQQVTGWGQRVMRLDQLPPTYRGQGVKVAIVDSGVATSHSDLREIRYGIDVVNKKTNQSTWNQDAIGHGSHCAGIIAGDADNGTGIRGFAPEAEIHVCKVFPGGQVSAVIDALEYCIEHQIDVVNLSLGTNQPSETLEQHLLRARRLGIACIVAAGNTGGPVRYPASSPNVLAVAAVGKIGEFPQDSYHAHTISGTGVGAGGYFLPRFSAFGPEIGVCAPGVAILSSVPPDNFAVWDGTCMAAPHISGLAALILAHHPDFQGAFQARDARRVDRLFQILRGSAQPLTLLDPRRPAFGVPDALVALGLAPPPQSAFPYASMMPYPFASFAPLWPQSWLSGILGQLGVFAGNPTVGIGAVGRPWF